MSDTLGVVVEDARFEFKEDKMQATVVDASHVAMIDLNRCGRPPDTNLGKIDRNIRPLDASTVNSPNLPNIEIPSSIEISGASLAQALRAAKQVGDLVNFSIDANSFTVHVQGQTDSVTVSFSKDELESLNCDKPARSQYSLTYLVPLSKVFGSLAKVKLGFGESFPLRLEFTFNDGAGEVVYFLAPRVETDY